MAECEVCGRESASRKAEIDGAVLNVCESCAKLGKVVYHPRPVQLQRKPVAPRTESIEDDMEMAGGFHMAIRKAREKRNLAQDEAAMKMGISAVAYRRIENGFRPDPQTARKIERFYGLSIIMHQSD